MKALNTDAMFAELQQGTTYGSAKATPVKLLATDREIKGFDGFRTYLESVDINDQAALGDKLIALLKRLLVGGKGGFTFGYDDCDYKPVFIKMDNILIDLPNKGEEGETLFDVYRHYTDETTKERIRESLASTDPLRRCTIVEGKTGNGFLIETYDRNLAPCAALADHLNCTIRGVMNRIGEGWQLVKP